MADVFISYAQEDRERVSVLADALKGEGFSLWWDPDLRIGQRRSVIQRELEAAASVVVVWTAASTKRDFVHDEADLADELGKLLPIAMDRAPRPLGFRTIWTEDFTGWNGERDAECWKRLIEQLWALKRAGLDQTQRPLPEGKPQVIRRPLPERPEPAEEPPPADTLPPEGPPPAGPHRIIRHRPAGGAETWFLGLLSLLAAGLLGVQQIRVLPGADTLASAVALSFFFLILFLQADRWLKPHTKALVARWLLPTEGGPSIRIAEAFLGMFEAVFGRRHLSWTCLARSALASTLGAALVVTVIEFTMGSFLLEGVKDRYWVPEGQRASFAALTVLLIFVPVNIVGDYFSLWETRLVLRTLRARPNLLVPLVLVDFVLTSTIFLSFLIAVNYGVGLWNDELAWKDVPGQLLYDLRGITELVIDFLRGAGDNAHGGGLIFAAFLTCFITSIWLWLVLVLAPLTRLTVWARSGVTGLGRQLNAEVRPVAALGYIVALLVVLAGLVLAAGQAAHVVHG